MSKAHEFNEKELMGSLEEALSHAKGKLTLKTTKLPKPVTAMTPARISNIRRKMKASTPVFASFLNVTPDTVRGWEKDRRRPSGPALRLLEIAEKSPQVLIA